MSTPPPPPLTTEASPLGARSLGISPKASPKAGGAVQSPQSLTPKASRSPKMFKSKLVSGGTRSSGTPKTNARKAAVSSSYSSSHSVEGFELADVLHKRRGGFGKHADNNWVPRCFTLHAGIFCYYDTADFSLIDPSRPRGRLDLGREDTAATLEEVEKVGAPSKYIVVVQQFIMGGMEKKWKMCCKDKQQQAMWHAALAAFDGQPDTNIGDSIIDFMGLSGHLSGHPNNPKPRPLPDLVHQFNNATRSAGNAAAAEMAGSLTGERDGADSNPMTPYALIAVANALLAFSRVAPIFGFWTALLLVNGILLKLLHTTLPDLPRAGKNGLGSAGSGESGGDDEEDLRRNRLASGEMLPPGNTMPLCPPAPESALARTLSEKKHSSAEGMRAAAANFSDWQDLKHSYRPGDATIFKVRCGPNYKRTGKKEPSDKSLFELYTVDLVRTPERLRESTMVFKPPSIPGVTDVTTGSAYIPPMIIVSCGIPSEEPSMFNSEPDGASFMAIFYFVISEETLAALKGGIDTAPPAVRLLEEWCRRSETEPAFRGRFKAMCILDDIEKQGLPMPIPGYNGKPVLINKSGEFFRRENHIEMTVNVHLFAYIARKMLYTIQPKFPTMCLNVGFVIEGRDDDELPEVMLGVGKLVYMDPASAPHGDELTKEA